jgi:hypothetical protein
MLLFWHGEVSDIRMRKNINYNIRKAHRYLGVILGIQFMLWTVGGLYFSWSDMEEIHGSHTRKATPLISCSYDLISPKVVIDSVVAMKKADSIASLQLVQILEKPYYQVKYVHTGGEHHHQQVQLADALTGELRAPLTKEEASAIARNFFAGNPEVTKVEYLEEADPHHEYRENALPAWAVQFNDPGNTTVYVAAELGTVQKFRNNKWRVFDFLWMLHTMDYQSRDNIGNILLKAFSIFGLFTIFSGFALYFISSPTFRKIRRRKTVA